MTIKMLATGREASKVDRSPPKIGRDQHGSEEVPEAKDQLTMAARTIAIGIRNSYAFGIISSVFLSVIYPL